MILLELDELQEAGRRLIQNSHLLCVQQPVEVSRGSTHQIWDYDESAAVE